ncbi:MAG: hypothetical protein ABSH20_13365 [Tepidisphaeraceae bacterium]|jgi:hypothetical protein
MQIIKLLSTGLCGLLWSRLLIAAELNLTIRDNIGRAWANEPITWDLPGMKGGKVLVRRDGAPIPAQIIATADGARVLFIIDRLAKDASTTITAEPGSEGPRDTDLSASSEAGALVLANKFTAVKVNNGSPDSLSPVLCVRTTSGKWTGGGVYDSGPARSCGRQSPGMTRMPMLASFRAMDWDASGGKAL